jgi:hypothetical protein
VLLSQAGILAGWASGVAGLLRRERLRWLPVIGWISSLCVIGLLIFFDEDG